MTLKPRAAHPEVSDLDHNRRLNHAVEYRGACEREREHRHQPKAQNYQGREESTDHRCACQQGHSEQVHGSHPTPKEVVATSHSSSPRAEHRRGGHHGAIRPAPDVQYTQALPGDSYLPRQDAFPPTAKVERKRNNG
jgi:hypothetical protein